MQCELCGGECWDNRETKRGKQPDWKCKDTKCNWAKWDKKEEGAPTQAPQGLKLTNYIPKPQANGKGIDAKAMIMSYAKDIVVALIASSGDKTVTTPFKKVTDGFRALYKEHQSPFTAGVEDKKVEEKEEENTEGLPF